MRAVDLCAIVHAIRATTSNNRRRYSRIVPVPESLEGRQLLSFLQPFGNKFERVRSGGALDVISVSGPGQVFTKRLSRSTVAISLTGTTQDSQVTMSSLAARPGELNSPLQIGKILVQTGRLGSFTGTTTADLDGPLSPLTGPVTSLQFDALGPGAQININGNLGQITINRGIDLGPAGRINVSNDLTGSLAVSRDVTLAGGQIDIGRDMDGPVTIGGSLTINDGGQFSVTRNLGASTASPTTSTSTTSAAPASGSGGVTVGGNLNLDSDGKLTVGGNVSSLTVGGNLEASSGGGIVVAGNLTSLTINGGGGASVTGDLTLNPGGDLTVGQNLSTLAVGSNLQLAQNSQFQVSGNLSSLSVGGNLQTLNGGELHVAGDLGTLAVTGIVQGKGNDDIVVGDDLAQLTVLGGGDGVQGLQGVNLSVTNNIEGVDIRNGIANSVIQAGFVINGGTPGAGSNSWNIGPDGATSPSSVDPDTGQIAVLNSTITAAYEIMNMTIGGDVVSDRPSDQSASVTRIVAGETLQGQFVPNGIIDSFQIVGSLVNSVVAASVAPNPGTGYYDQPAGAIEVGFVADAPTSNSAITPTQNITVQTSGVSNVGLNTSTTTPYTQVAQVQNSPLPVFTAPPFASPQDPELKVVLSGGSVNPSFAPKLQLVPPAAPEGSELPLPSKSTVLGSVTTTAKGENGSDYSGIYATNTNGVIVGPLPTSAPVTPTP